MTPINGQELSEQLDPTSAPDTSTLLRTDRDADGAGGVDEAEVQPASAMAMTHLCEFDFMKCQKCGRICTNREVVEAVKPFGHGTICPCGSMKYAPHELSWREYHLPQVIRYTREGFSEASTRADLWMEASTGADRVWWGARVVYWVRLFLAQLHEPPAAGHRGLGRSL